MDPMRPKPDGGTAREFPPWLKIRLRGGQGDCATRSRLGGLATVCEEAACPNIAECWAHGHATIMILGRGCTRHCRFCNVSGASPTPPDPDEPSRVAAAIAGSPLSEVVITSVTRDDLADGGAAHWAETVRAIRSARPDVSIEALVPDFQGDRDALATVIAAHPDILGHNIETVPRLYPAARPEAGYERSLKVLQAASSMGARTKSAMMLGLGETDEEIRQVLRDLRASGVGSLVLGQYLRPSPSHLPVVEFVHPDRFEEYGRLALSLGFEDVVATPLARSSYRLMRREAP
ncbi:MAG: lipoyl synthase [Kiritimatiellae bacterium]|nr:lipoyl synthase [Kiritimatiellia bacterium]